jgi:hypothetical protein
MNYLPNRTTEQASGHDQAVVSLIGSQTALLSSNGGNPIVNELALEEEMNRRAGLITDVLARIMEQPTAQRHWRWEERSEA